MAESASTRYADAVDTTGAFGGCIRATGCVWSANKYKHFPFAKMKPSDTAPPNEARYLADEGSIRTLETATAQLACRRSILSSGKAQYLRETGNVIGWDEGYDATLSYVECSCGANAGRSFHGRPMRAGNAKRP